jgi:hypothetical protein
MAKYEFAHVLKKSPFMCLLKDCESAKSWPCVAQCQDIVFLVPDSCRATPRNLQYKRGCLKRLERYLFLLFLDNLAVFFAKIQHPQQYQYVFTVESQDNIPECTKTHTIKTAFNLVKIHLLLRIVLLIQWSVIICRPCCYRYCWNLNFLLYKRKREVNHSLIKTPLKKFNSQV